MTTSPEYQRDQRVRALQLCETARLCALVRARETARQRPRVVDPFAARFLRTAESNVALRQLRQIRHYRRVHDGIIVRTVVLDELVQHLVWRRGVRCVLNLGAGFDTRPYRLDLPEDCVWIEADMPDVVREKQETLGRECRACTVISLSLDLTDPLARLELFAMVAQVQAQSKTQAQAKACVGGDGPTLVLSEGLVLYLTPGEIRALANDLARQPSLRYWLLDLGSARSTINWMAWSSSVLTALATVQSGQSGQSALTAADSAVRFVGDDGMALLAASGWQRAQSMAFIEEAHRLRAIAPWTWWGYRYVERWGTSAQAAHLREAVQFVLLVRDRAPARDAV